MPKVRLVNAMPLKLQENLAVAAERIQKNDARVPIRRNGKIIAAVVSAEDFKTLEAMDRADLRAHRRALALARKRGEKPIPIAVARKLLGL